MNLFRREDAGERYPLGLQKGAADGLEVRATIGTLGALALGPLFRPRLEPLLWRRRGVLW